MRFFILLFIMITSGCASLDNDLQKALVFGNIKELNEYNSEVDKQLLIRLYSSPVYKENCFFETHGICKYKYFISVSTFDEYPETNIDKLQNEGEITEINWINTSDIDSAELKLIFNHFSVAALKNNSTLINHQKIVNIKVNPSEISETATLIK
ncbi:MAG: hypothetical protein ACI9T9_002984 [Oleiphilaceae bacterium]|jgi:hypothetical protein